MMSKFSFSQMTSNSTGKTSASGSMGCLICTAGSIVFLYATFTKQMEVINQAVIFTGLGAGLLGYRKSKESVGLINPPEDPSENTPDTTSPDTTSSDTTTLPPSNNNSDNQPLNS